MLEAAAPAPDARRGFFEYCPFVSKKASPREHDHFMTGRSRHRVIPAVEAIGPHWIMPSKVDLR
jgi:hypothetical protein